MNTRDLACFVRVYELRSISAAARDLYLTPQAVSKMIRRVETELDADLFDRSAGGMSATVYGDLFYTHAVQILQAYRESLREVHQLKLQNAGILKMVSAFGILRLLSPEFIRTFTEKHPDIHIDYMEFPDRYVEEHVLDEEYDFGLVPFLDRNPDLTYIPLFSREIFFVANRSSRFYDRSEVSVREICAEPLVIENRNFLIHHILTDLCEREGCTPDIYFNTSGFSLCYKLCREGTADTVSMDFIFDDMADHSTELHRIPFREHPMWNIALIVRKGIPLTPALNTFISYARDRCRKI